jgi:Dolichyl-phosphate-mannose-protein mannosyltransferase
MTKKWFWGIAALLFGVLIYFATDRLTETPPTWFDEGVIVQVAINNSLHDKDVIQVAPNIYETATYVTSGFTFLEPISWSFSVFGIGLLQARVVMVVFIMLTVATFFTFVYFLFGRLAALASLALLITFPPLYGQGKNVLGEVPGLFYMVGFLLAFYRLEQNKYEGARWYVAAAVAAGLCVATKPIFILLLPAVAVAIALRYRSITFHWKYIGLGLTSFLIPIGIWFFGRFTTSDSLAQLLTYYSNPYAIPDLHAKVLDNIARFFGEAAPAYFALMMVVWAAAIALRAWRREKISIAETIVFVFALLVTAAYLRTEGWYRYFFLAEVPALVMLPFALKRVADEIFMQKTALSVWACLVIFFLAVQTNQLLVGSWVAQHGERTTTHDLQTYMATLPKDALFFVYNTPIAVIFLPNQNYYQYLELNTAVHLGTDQLPALEQGIPDYVVTNDRVWNVASTTLMSKYKVIKTIDAIVVAGK